MKRIILSLAALLVFTTSCIHEITEDKYEIDVYMKIVAMNYDGSSLSDDKFHSPQNCNIILFETITEPKLYREINTCNLPPADNEDRTDIHIDNVWLYNHSVGDTVHFDYLIKSKFFTINKRNGKIPGVVTCSE